MSEPTLSRRTALRRGAAVAGVGAAVGIGGLRSATGSSAALSVDADDQFIADDVDVERNDGELDAVTVAPSLDVVWADFGGGLEAVDVTLSAAIVDEPGFDVLYDGSVADADAVAVEGDDLEAVSGSVELAFDRRDLTDVGGDVTAGDFGTDLDPGESETTAVELTLRVDVDGAQGDAVTALETVEFDVTVENPEGEATTTGRANTGAE